MARDQPNFGVTFDEEIEANATREDQDFLLSAYGNTDSEVALAEPPIFSERAEQREQHFGINSLNSSFQDESTIPNYCYVCPPEPSGFENDMGSNSGSLSSHVDTTCYSDYGLSFPYDTIYEVDSSYPEYEDAMLSNLQSVMGLNTIQPRLYDEVDSSTIEGLEQPWYEVSLNQSTHTPPSTPIDQSSLDLDIFAPVPDKLSSSNTTTPSSDPAVYSLSGHSEFSLATSRQTTTKKRKRSERQDSGSRLLPRQPEALGYEPAVKDISKKGSKQGIPHFRWSAARLNRYTINGWNIPCWALDGPEHPIESRVGAPANTDFSGLENLEISAWEILVWFPLCTVQFGIVHRFVENGWTPAEIAHAINIAHGLPLADTKEVDTIKHQCERSDIAYYHMGWSTKRKGEPNATRVKITDFTAKRFLENGASFRPHDNYGLEDPLLVDLAAGISPELWPQGAGRLYLTNAIEIAVREGLTESKLSDLPALVKRYGLDQIIQPMSKEPNADAICLRGFNDYIRRLKSQKRKQQNQEKISRGIPIKSGRPRKQANGSLCK